MGLALLLEKNINNKLSTTEGFWGGGFIINEFLGWNNNNWEKRNLKNGLVKNFLKMEGRRYGNYRKKRKKEK